MILRSTDYKQLIHYLTFYYLKFQQRYTGKSNDSHNSHKKYSDDFHAKYFAGK